MQTIPRAHKPSRKEFEDQFLRKNTPVIITGVVNEWPAHELWTPPYMNAKLGMKELSITYSNPGRDNSSARTMVNADEFFAGVENPLTEGNPYLNIQPMPKVLDADIRLPIYFNHEDLLFRSFAFGAKTVTELHYHQSTEAFFCCIKGSKRFMMYSPEQSPHMYARPFYAPNFQHSHVIASNPDLQKYPDFKNAKCIELTVNEGEMLYVPIHWWHAVYGSPALNVNLTLFWLAKGSAVLLPKSGKLHQWASLAVRRPVELKKALGRFVRGR